MKVNVKDLIPNMSGIYKLNYPNGKIYIGMSCDIKRRMKEHNYNCHEYIPPCDLAIKKYGKMEEVEILEFTSEDKMIEREKYWIKYFNANNRDVGYNLTEGDDGSGRPGENNPVATFSNGQVLDIRKRRFNGEKKIDVYKDYSDKSFSTFEHIWLGRGYPGIGIEYLIPTGSKTRQEYSSEANRGSKNCKAKLNEDDVRAIRKRFDAGETVDSLLKDYSFVSKSTMNKVCRRYTWKHID